MGKGEAGISNAAGVVAPEPKVRSQRESNEARQEVLIGGRVYDITGFADRHPGGSIIKFQVDTDATDAYANFHGRSAKADKFLNALPSRPFGSEPGDEARFFRAGKDYNHRGPSKDAEANAVPPEDKAAVVGQKLALVRDFRKLTDELKAEGVFDPSLPNVLFRNAELVALHAVGIALLYMSSGVSAAAGWAAWLAGLAVLSIAQGRCGWWMHECGHYSATGSVWVDQRLQEFWYGFGCGMSAAFWRNQHNKHHASPQKWAHDVDLNTLPLVAFNAIAYLDKAGKKRRRGALGKAWLSLQAALFIPVICLLVALGWQFYSHPRHSFRTGRYQELGWMALRYVCWIMLLQPLLGLSALQSFGLYLLYDQIGGAYIFTNFAVSHTHLDILKPDEHVTWIEYATDYTMNVDQNPLVNWWMSYLNFQIEHHLWPNCPQFRFPQVSHRVRTLMQKHGRNYHSKGYFTAIGSTLLNLHDVGAQA